MTKSQIDELLKRTAIHEASHAVVATVLNYPFDSISIVPERCNCSVKIVQNF